MPTRDAIKIAEGRSLDLVEVSPGANPPVCKIMDFGKYKFQLQRKKNENKKKQKVSQLKEIKLRPTIDKHDLGIKIKQMRKFLETGDRVKISLRFRGREITHTEIGMRVMEQIKTELLDICKVDMEPRMDGKQILMIIVPKA